MSIKSKYHQFIQFHLPKVLTQIDRDPDSPTFGCCDRNYWHYKIRDFPSAILQQSGFTLAKLFLMDIPDNELFQNQTICDVAIATLNYWMKIQLKDGSFNEYYPYEHGFPPTAFSFFSACEIYRTLGLENPRILKAFKKTGTYLSKTVEEKASNQEMASITALYSYFLITDDEAIKSACEIKLQRFLQTQSPEGWFPEYGGADFGYQSVCLDMLAMYYYLSKDERVIEPMKKITAFMKWFVHPDRTIGGEYGSRNTLYFLPFGLEVLASIGDEAAIAMREAIFTKCDQKDYFQNAIDDRYFTHYVLHSFVRALEITPQEDIPPQNKLPFQLNGEMYFPHSGLFIKSETNYFIICSLKKGGILKVFNKEKEIFADFGYRINAGDGRIATTNWLDPSYTITYDPKNNQIAINGYFNTIKPQTSSTLMHAGLRGLSFLLGRRLISFLKNKMIFIDKHLDVAFSRQINFHKDSLTIEDTFQSPKKISIKSAPPFSL